MRLRLGDPTDLLAIPLCPYGVMWDAYERLGGSVAPGEPAPRLAHGAAPGEGLHGRAGLQLDVLEVRAELVEDGAVFPQHDGRQLARLEVGQAVDQVVDVGAHLVHGHAGGVLQVVCPGGADEAEHALYQELGVAASVGARVVLLQPDDEPGEVRQVDFLQRVQQESVGHVAVADRLGLVHLGRVAGVLLQRVLDGGVGAAAGGLGVATHEGVRSVRFRHVNRFLSDVVCTGTCWLSLQADAWREGLVEGRTQLAEHVVLATASRTDLKVILRWLVVVGYVPDELVDCRPSPDHVDLVGPVGGRQVTHEAVHNSHDVSEAVLRVEPCELCHAPGVPVSLARKARRVAQAAIHRLCDQYPDGVAPKYTDESSDV